MIKVDDGQPAHRNLKVFWVGKEGKGGEEDVREVAGFSQKSYDQW
jgi:hypothetical protein